MKVNWIPMSEKQPAKQGRYMITVETWRYENCKHVPYRQIYVDDWDDLGEFWEEWEGDVLAWAELPAPYDGK